MKRGLLIGVCVVFFSVFFLVWQNWDAPGLLSQGSGTSEPVAAARALGVEQFMRNAEQYRQSTVAIQGVVSSVSTENQLVGLIDTREFKDCKITTCSALTLPVQWAGAMPQVQETIQVTGTLQQRDGSFVFRAQDLEKQG